MVGSREGIRGAEEEDGEKSKKRFREVGTRTSRLTLVSSMSTWSKQLMGARNMSAFMSSMNGTQAAGQDQKKNYTFVSPTHPHTHNSGSPENEGGFFFRHDKTTL